MGCRFAEAVKKRPGQELRYEFVDSSLLGTAEWKEAVQYDVITCMFAIHYFFVTEQALKQVLWEAACWLSDWLGLPYFQHRWNAFMAIPCHVQFLHNVSINLKDGGYFFGTVPDGKRVNECIKRWGSRAGEGLAAPHSAASSPSASARPPAATGFTSRLC